MLIRGDVPSAHPLMLELGFDLFVLPRNRVSRVLMSRSRGPQVRWLVSIGDPGTRAPAGSARVAAKLRLEVEDVIDPSLPFAPTRTDVERIVRFGRRLPTDGIAISHCDAGISRSSAAAIIALAACYADASEEEVVATVLAGAPGLHPNRLMIRLADDVLGREQRLVDAVRRRFS